MPCRALNICRQATNPQQCLWITDDVLADAWNRFARVSTAASKRRCEGRRYGSNVPGPLEAHRRLSKRRMGVAAVASGAPPMGADFGALFGIGSFKPEQQIDGWRWEAPQLDRRKPHDTTTDTGWFRSSNTKQQEAWDSFLQPPALEEDVPDTKEEAPTKDQIIEQSKLDLYILLSDVSHLQHIEAAHLVKVVEFLQSTADEPKAGNLTAFFQWLKGRELSGGAFSALVMLVREKVELGTCGDDLTTALAALLQHAQSTASYLDVASILDAIQHEEVGEICTKITRELFHTTSATFDAGAEASLPAVKTWLQCLSLCRHLQGWHCDSTAWQDIYATLAQYIDKPSILARHFLTLHRLDLSRILLRHWARAANTEPWSETDQSEPTVSIVGVEKRLSYRQLPGEVDFDAVLRDFDALRTARYERKQQRVQTSSPLVDMLDVARRHGLRHNWLCEELFDILMHTSSVTSVQKVSWEIRSHKDLGLTSRTALRLVQYFLRHEKLNFAHSLFRAMPTLSLLHAHELPIKLAREGTVGSSEIWEILQRQLKEDFVEVQHRDAQTPELTLVPEHIDLIHLVAHAFAHSSALAPRIAFRRVWQCYLFLRDRRAPINSLLTRALVHAGVTRQLKALKRPSTEQFRYIINLVARIEGQETAEKLDRAVFKYWNEHVKPNLIELRRRVDHALDLSEGAVEERRTASYNLRRWSRQHRPWLSKKRHAAGTPKLDGARRIKAVSPAPSDASIATSEGILAFATSSSLSTSREPPSGHNVPAVEPGCVPLTSSAEGASDPSLPVRTTTAPMIEEIKVTGSEPMPLAPRQGLGYGSPRSALSAANASSQQAIGGKPASSFAIAEKAESERFHAEDAEQLGGKRPMRKLEAKSPGLLQKRLPLYFRKHDVSSKSSLLENPNSVEAHEAEKSFHEEALGQTTSKVSRQPLVNMPNETPESVRDVKIAKLKPLAVAEKKSLELQGICVRCRQQGHRAGDARCPGNTWHPNPKYSVQPTQPEYEYLQWRLEPGKGYTLYLENDGEWRIYSQIQGRVRQIRRWAKKTGRAHDEQEFKLLEKWEQAQDEMAKRQAALRGTGKEARYSGAVWRNVVSSP